MCRMCVLVTSGGPRRREGNDSFEFLSSFLPHIFSQMEFSFQPLPLVVGQSHLKQKPPPGPRANSFRHQSRRADDSTFARDAPSRAAPLPPPSDPFAMMETQAPAAHLAALRGARIDADRNPLPRPRAASSPPPIDAPAAAAAAKAPTNPGPAAPSPDPPIHAAGAEAGGAERFEAGAFSGLTMATQAALGGLHDLLDPSSGGRGLSREPGSTEPRAVTPQMILQHMTQGGLEGVDALVGIAHGIENTTAKKPMRSKGGRGKGGVGKGRSEWKVFFVFNLVDEQSLILYDLRAWLGGERAADVHFHASPELSAQARRLPLPTPSRSPSRNPRMSRKPSPSPSLSRRGARSAPRPLSPSLSLSLSPRMRPRHPRKKRRRPRPPRPKRRAPRSPSRPPGPAPNAKPPPPRAPRRTRASS